MDWDIAAVFPIELWEKIMLFCDGKSLITLSKTNQTFKSIILSLNERRNIWKSRCYDEISEDDLTDTYHKLYAHDLITPIWSNVFYAWFKWGNLSASNFSIIKIPKLYLWITDIKVSNDKIIIADNTGFTVLNSVSKKRKRYKIGPVKHLEIFCRRSPTHSTDAQFSHDILDCTVGNFHLFFDLHRAIHLRCDKHENQILRYCYGQKKYKFVPPILEANIYDDLTLLVTETSIRQAVLPMNVISEYFYTWAGARCWFLWHARLLFCAKDETFDIYLDGRLRTFSFGLFSRITAVFYFKSILFLGTVTGTLYIYRLRADDIFSFNFCDYELALDVCVNPIVAIDVVENNSKNSCIVVASDQEIYQIFPETFSTCL